MDKRLFLVLVSVLVILVAVMSFYKYEFDSAGLAYKQGVQHEPTSVIEIDEIAYVIDANDSNTSSNSSDDISDDVLVNTSVNSSSGSIVDISEDSASESIVDISDDGTRESIVDTSRGESPIDNSAADNPSNKSLFANIAADDTSSLSLVDIAADNSPSISLIAPVSSTRHVTGYALHMIAMTQGNISKVEFYDESTKLGEDTTAPYLFEWSNVTVGTHTLSARAITDSGTLTSNSATIATSAQVANPTLPLSISPYGDHPLYWWGSDLYDDWSVQTLRDRALIVANPHPDSVNPSATALQFALHYSDNYTGFVNNAPRAEMYNYFRYQPGTEYRYVFKTYLPPDYQFDTDAFQQEMFFTQIYPTFGIGFKGSNYYSHISGENLTSEKTIYTSAIPDLGKWVSWEIQLKQSGVNGSGYLKIKKDGVQIYSGTRATLPSPQTESYSKWGPYKWTWKSYPTNVTDVYIYYDDLQIFDVTNNITIDRQGFASNVPSESVYGWWDSDSTDNTVWTKRLPISLNETRGVARTNEPVVIKLSDVFGYDFNFSQINKNSMRVVDSSADPEEQNEIYGNDVPSQIEDIDVNGKLSSLDLIVFMTNAQANSNKVYYIYYTDDTTVQSKVYAPISWNILTNPSFESGSGIVATNWTNTQSSRVNDAAHTGSYSAKIITTNRSQSFYARQVAALVPSKFYESITIGGWAKTLNLGDSRDRQFGLYNDFYFDSDSPNYANTAAYDTGTHDWQYSDYILSLDSNVSKLNKVSSVVRIDEHVGTMWYDDLFVYGTPYDIIIGDVDNFGFKILSPTSIHNYVANEVISANIRANMALQSVQCSVINAQGSTVGTFTVYDDGTHGDTIAGDWTWTNTNAYTMPASLSKSIWQTACIATTGNANTLHDEVRFVVVNSLGDLHPRLYFKSSDIPSLLARMQVEPTKTWWTQINNYASSANSFPTEYDGNQYDMVEHMRVTAFDYALTGDLASGNKAKNWLLQACAWPNWNDVSVAPPELNYYAGHIPLIVAESYDMIYPLLNDTEREFVRKALVDKGLNLMHASYESGAYHTHAFSNRGGHLYGGNAVGLLAIMGDTPEYTTMQPYATDAEQIMSVYTEGYDSEGGWPEGISYQSYGLDDCFGAIFYFEAMKNTKGVDLYSTAGVRDMMNFPLYLLPPDRQGAGDAFSDQAYNTYFEKPIVLRFASLYNDDSTKWYYNNVETRMMICENFLAFLWYTNTTTSFNPNTLPESKLFPDMGWAALRTGWNTNDTLIMFRSGPYTYKDQHNRPEQNSFTFDALGKRLIIEAGIPSYGYEGDFNYYYPLTVAHNTYLVDNNNESQQSLPDSVTIHEQPAGRVTDLLFSDFYDETSGEASAAYKGVLSEYTRNLAFIKQNNYIVIADHLSAPSAHEYDALFHTFGRNTISVNGSTITFNQNPVKLYIKVLEPSTFQSSISAGGPILMLDGEKNTSYIKIWPSTQSANATFLYVLYPVNGSAAPPTMTKLQSGNVIGVKIDHTGSTDIILFNTSGGSINLGGVVTNGNKAYVRFTPTTITHFAMHNATYISFNGTSIHNSLNRTSLAQTVSIGIVNPNTPEVRAAWIYGGNLTSESECDNLINSLVNAHFNTIILLVPSVNGNYGSDSDPALIHYLATHAKNAGLNVHGMLAMNRRTSINIWPTIDVDFTSPSEQVEQVNWVLDTLATYPEFDGIQLDFIRYSDSAVPNATKMRGVTQTVKRIRIAMKQQYPTKLLSATNLPASEPMWQGAIYGGTPTYEGATPLWYQNWFNSTYPNNWYYARAFADHPANPVPIYGPHGMNYQQDGFDWLAKNYIDVLMPMQYTTNNSLWNSEVDIWNTLGPAAGYDSRKVVHGIGWDPSWGSSVSSVSSHISYGRNNSVKGFSIFIIGMSEDATLFNGLSGSLYAAPTPSWMTNYSTYKNYLGLPNSPPLIEFEDNMTVTLPEQVILRTEAADIDGTIAKVEFFQGANKLGEDISYPYTYNWSSASAGTYLITAKATDNSGAVATSTNISVKVLPLVDSNTSSQYYVSPSGSDSNDGHSPAKAWKTINRVNNAVYLPGDTIYFERGQLWRETLVIPSDGTGINHITISAYGTGNRPIISGSDVISGWTLYNASTNIYVANVPSTTNQLFVDGKRQTLARWPNSGFATITGDMGSYTSLTSTSLVQEDNYWANSTIIIRPTYYSLDTKKVTSNSKTAHTITWAGNTLHDNPGTDWGFYIEGKCTEIDQVGEWCYNAGKVYIKVATGDNPNNHLTEAAIRNNSINTNHKDNIIIANLSVRHTQSFGIFVFRSNYTFVIDNVVDSTGGGIIYDACSTGCNYHYARIIGNQVNNSWRAEGIYIRDGMDHVIIARNNISEIGSEPLASDGATDGIRTNYWSDYAQITDNIIRNVGNNGIWWYGRHSTINNNEVSGCELSTSDEAAIYMSMNQTNMTIAYNTIHDIHGNWDGTPTRNQVVNNAVGLYCDYNCSGVTMLNNLVYNINGYAILVLNSAHNNFYGNTLYNTSLDVFGISEHWAGATNNNNIKGNIMFGYGTQHAYAQSQYQDANHMDYASLDNNIYYRAQSTTPIRAVYRNGSQVSYALVQWRDMMGTDNLSLSLDPLFAENFNLNWNSAAIDSGINIGQIRDYYGNPIYGAADIGAIEYQPPYTIDTDAIKTSVSRSIRIYGDGKYRNTNDITYGPAVPLTVSPAGGFNANNKTRWMDITILQWNSTLMNWTENSSAGSVRHSLCGLASGSQYSTYYSKIGTRNLVSNYTANISGCLSFNYSQGYPVAFEVILPANISIVNNAPIVTITYPANAATFTEGTNITINATATDTDGTIFKVEFYRNNSLIYIDSSAPYTYSWTNIAVGAYSWYARAYDNLDLSRNSTQVNVNVVPYVCSNGQNTSCTTGLFGICAAGTKTCSNNAWSACTQNRTATTEICGNGIDENCDGGDQSCFANSPPTITITSPLNGATFTEGTNITINATAADTDGAIESVKFYKNNTLQYNDTTSPYTYTWTNITAGNYSLTATARDNQGATTSNTKNITIIPSNTATNQSEPNVPSNESRPNITINYYEYIEYTNLTVLNATQLQRIEHFILKTSNGKIRFIEPINITKDIVIDGNIMIHPRSIVVLSNALYEFNKSADLEFYNIISSDVTPYVEGTICPDVLCTNRMYDQGSDIYSMSVTHFTNYTILYCGDDICNRDETCSTCPYDCGACESQSGHRGGGSGGLGGFFVPASSINTSTNTSTSHIASAPVNTTKSNESVHNIEQPELIISNLTNQTNVTNAGMTREITFSFSSILLAAIVIIVILLVFVVARRRSEPVRNSDGNSQHAQYAEYINYLNRARMSGMTDDTIRQKLKSTGWSDKQVDFLFNLCTKP